MLENTEEILLRLLTAIREDDLFRVVIRGFGVFEDLLEAEIASLLEERMDGLEGAPVRHKLSLAVGVGLIDPEMRPAFSRLAKLRHDLAHADRDSEDVTRVELAEIRVALDPQRSTDALVPEGVTPTLPVLAGLTILAAYSAIQVAGSVARRLRDQEREAFRREVASGTGVDPLAVALLQQLRGTGAQAGAQEP